MPATIIVGGQYGSEGKGKVTALVASRARFPFLVRCGGPNSGHTVTVRGRDFILRQVPCSIDPSHGVFCIAAGCVIDEEVLLHELELMEIDHDRIIVDPRAVLVTEEDRGTERSSLEHIASTCSGTGAAVVRRMSRQNDLALAKDSARIVERCRVEAVAPALHDALDRGREVIVEGTQGFALSLLHGPDYPYVTSRDTTASGFAMEVGLSPRVINEIVMVVRTFPIRVGGTSGPLADEISWEEIQRISGTPKVLPEYTSVTKRLRRVAWFDMASVVRACKYNRPTKLAVMGMDRLNYADTGMTTFAALSPKSRAFIEQLEATTGVPVEFAGTGFRTFDVAIAHASLRRTCEPCLK